MSVAETIKREFGHLIHQLTAPANGTYYPGGELLEKIDTLGVVKNTAGFPLNFNLFQPPPFRLVSVQTSQCNNGQTVAEYILESDWPQIQNHMAELQEQADQAEQSKTLDLNHKKGLERSVQEQHLTELTIQKLQAEKENLALQEKIAIQAVAKQELTLQQTESERSHRLRSYNLFELQQLLTDKITEHQKAEEIDGEISSSLLNLHEFLIPVLEKYHNMDIFKIQNLSEDLKFKELNKALARSYAKDIDEAEKNTTLSHEAKRLEIEHHKRMMNAHTNRQEQELRDG